VGKVYCIFVEQVVCGGGRGPLTTFTVRFVTDRSALGPQEVWGWRTEWHAQKFLFCSDDTLSGTKLANIWLTLLFGFTRTISYRDAWMLQWLQTFAHRVINYIYFQFLDSASVKLELGLLMLYRLDKLSATILKISILRWFALRYQLNGKVPIS